MVQGTCVEELCYLGYGFNSLSYYFRALLIYNILCGSVSFALDQNPPMTTSADGGFHHEMIVFGAYALALVVMRIFLSSSGFPSDLYRWARLIRLTK